VDAIATNPDEGPSFDPKNRMPIPRDVLRICSSLVVVRHSKNSPDQENVQLAHFSVKEYLISDHVSRAFKSLIGEKVARPYLVRLCLGYLFGVSQRSMRGPSMDPDSSWSTMKEFPFLNYSVMYWMDHARMAEREDKDSCELVLSFFETERTAFSLFAMRYDNSTKKRSRLVYAASGGLIQTILKLVERGKDINAHDGAALQAASSKGRDTTVQFLLDEGADVNAGHGGALLAAVSGKRETTVQLLLDRGAVTHDAYNSVLVAAVLKGYDTIVQLLLDRGADVNAENGEALIQAVTHGQDATIQLLLDRGADVDARDGEALVTAANYRSSTTVRLLLGRGAKINARHGEALRVATDGCRDPTVRLLIESGADVNTLTLMRAWGNCQDTTWQLMLETSAKRDNHSVLTLTALQEISWSGYERLVERLLYRRTSIATELESAWMKQLRRVARRLIDKSADNELLGIEWLDLLLAGGWSARTIRQILKKNTPLEANHLVSAMMDSGSEAETIVLAMLPYLSAAAAAKESLENRWNLMHYAALCGSETVTQRCLDLGVDVHAEDQWKRTPLHYAVACGHLVIIKMLVRAGSDVEALDDGGETLLAWIEEGDCAIFNLGLDDWRGLTSRYDTIRYLRRCILKRLLYVSCMRMSGVRFESGRRSGTTTHHVYLRRQHPVACGFGHTIRTYKSDPPILSQRSRVLLARIIRTFYPTDRPRSYIFALNPDQA
jgi:ankyrin repeat protein